MKYLFLLLVLLGGCEPRNSVNVGRNEGVVNIEQDSRKKHNDEVTRLAAIYMDSVTSYQSLCYVYLDKGGVAQDKALDNLGTPACKRWLRLARKYQDTVEIYRLKSVEFIELREKLHYK